MNLHAKAKFFLFLFYINTNTHVGYKNYRIFVRPCAAVTRWMSLLVGVPRTFNTPPDIQNKNKLNCFLSTKKFHESFNSINLSCYYSCYKNTSNQQKTLHHR